MSTFGIQNEGTAFSMPQFSLPEEDTREEKKRAAYAESDEYLALEKHLLERAAYFQAFLPDGREVTSEVDLTDWIVANKMIREITNIITTYRTIAETYRDVK